MNLNKTEKMTSTYLFSSDTLADNLGVLVDPDVGLGGSSRERTS